MAGTIQGKRGGAIIGINVTPMVDVVLVLLVIMMVSATYIVSQSLKVELPKTATSDSVNTPIAVTITKEGRKLFNQEPVTEDALVAKLRAAAAGDPDVSLVISADRDALHGTVVSVIDLAKVAGITKFAINVERAK